jgi:hypothetical protein
MATAWSQVKYAFCSAQGAFGVLVDFQGADLSASRSGKARLGVRPCDGSAPFKWGDPVAFTGSVSNATLTFDFGNSLSPNNCIGCGDDTIQVGGTVEQGITGDGVMGGNSGPCVFLMNKATGGDVFSSEPLFSCK